MVQACLKLTIYFGERDRVVGAGAGGRFLADALIEIFARHELATSLVMRGVEGFGIKHHLRTDRLLTLSEDLPLVAVAVDAPDRIERALAEVRELQFDGLVTLERARIAAGAGSLGSGFALPAELESGCKLTVYVGRHGRSDGEPVHRAVVGALHMAGFHGATALLGVDGTAHGTRRRARFFSRNEAVPVMVIAVGDGELITAALPRLADLLPQPLVTFERVTVCKRAGTVYGPPPPVPATDPSGLGIWQKLMVHAGEQAGGSGPPVHHALIRRLRSSASSGATTLRGIWGFDGAREPAGDRLWQVRRHVPAVTVVVDTPPRIAAAFELADALTSDGGLITAETVPAFRATGPGLRQGGLRLAARSPE